MSTGACERMTVHRVRLPFICVVRCVSAHSARLSEPRSWACWPRDAEGETTTTTVRRRSGRRTGGRRTGSRTRTTSRCRSTQHCDRRGSTRPRRTRRQTATEGEADGRRLWLRRLRVRGATRTNRAGTAQPSRRLPLVRDFRSARATSRRCSCWQRSGSGSGRCAEGQDGWPTTSQTTNAAQQQPQEQSQSLQAQ